MDTPMNWLSDPQSGYIIAAYGVAASGLLGLLLVSLLDYRRSQTKWRRLQAAKQASQPPDSLSSRS